MKNFKIVLMSLLLCYIASCSSSDDAIAEEEAECVTCEAYNTAEGSPVPEMEVCKGDNGNAFLGSTDTTIEYNTYVETQRAVTTCN